MTVVSEWLLLAHIATCRKGDQLRHLKFRREVATALLRIGVRKNGPEQGPKVSNYVLQRKSVGHYIIAASQGRCRENTRFQCNKRNGKKGCI
ncbi:hypothetical protein AVEN_123793-1 [Araneus ventricosus]|uniref:Uncharacterized protein n=1 Tax=Araneus ventricosus TaxID=182803 RepID=A0A4Y2BK33_ARAVE|nr:hypothetical protein AVEN_123793-1 [Araneus ventricosus]